MKSEPEGSGQWKLMGFSAANKEIMPVETVLYCET
jgi:hypothetical protein